MEKILKIEQVSDVDKNGVKLKEKAYYNDMDGYKVTTDKQEILCLISNEQSCCEDSGYMSSEDDLSTFIGADLNSIEVVDTALNVKKWNVDFKYGLDSGDAVFLNFNTSKGTFQLVVYNAHNGFYGHSVVIKSEQVEIVNTI